MYTVFYPEQEAFIRETLSKHLSFEKGEWSDRSLRMYQTEKLRRTLRYVQDNSPFYARRMREIDAQRIDSFELEQLAELPFTTKDDLRSNPLDILSKPITDGWVFYETTGTTGRATPCPRDATDSAVNNIALTVNYASILRKHQRRHFVAVMGPTELHSTGDTFGEIFRNLGQTVVKMWPHSPVVGYQRALEVMREFGVTAMVCTPGMAVSLAREALLAGLSPKVDFDLSFIMVVGELATPALLENIATIWDTSVYNCMYASQESSILAAVRDDGRLRSIPLNAYYEIIDPNTDGHAERTDDGILEGELVITHLYQGCKPLVRYRTGDMVRLVRSGEETEYPSDIVEPLGRTRDRIVINGRVSYAFDLEQLVLEHVSGSYGYQVVIDESNGSDQLSVTVEYLDNDNAAAALDKANLSVALERRYGISPIVRIGRIGTIATTGAMVSWKASRIHDRRVPDDPERAAALAIASQRDA